MRLSNGGLYIWYSGGLFEDRRGLLLWAIEHPIVCVTLWARYTVSGHKTPINQIGIEVTA